MSSDQTMRGAVSIQVKLGVIEERLRNTLELMEKDGLRSDAERDKYRSDIRLELDELHKMTKRIGNTERDLKDARERLEALENGRKESSDRRRAESHKADTDLKKSRSGLYRKIMWLIGLLGAGLATTDFFGGFSH